MTDQPATRAVREEDLLARISAAGFPSVIWEPVPSNGWWRAYAATRRDHYGTPEDDEGTTRMGAGPTRVDALERLLECVHDA